MGAMKNAARNKQGGSVSSGHTGSETREFGFVECELDSEDKAAIVAYIESGEFGVEGIDVLIADGYDHACKRDKRGDGYMATLIDRSPESPFFNKCLVGRGASPAMARSALLYKHVYKLVGDWSTASNPSKVDFG